jgi:hypothetical protein
MCNEGWCCCLVARVVLLLPFVGDDELRSRLGAWRHCQLDALKGSAKPVFIRCIHINQVKSTKRPRYQRSTVFLQSGAILPTLPRVCYSCLVLTILLDCRHRCLAKLTGNTSVKILWTTGYLNISYYSIWPLYFPLTSSKSLYAPTQSRNFLSKARKSSQTHSFRHTTLLL